MTSYLWAIDDGMPERLYGVWDEHRSPDRFLFRCGESVSKDVGVPVISFPGSLRELGEWDVLVNTSQLPLVGPKAFKVLLARASRDIQVFPTKILARNGQSDAFRLVNVMNKSKCIDHAASEYSYILNTKHIGGFRRLRYTPDCMGAHHMVRDAEYLGHIAVSEQLAEDIKDSGLTGVDLILPEEFYGKALGRS